MASQEKWRSWIHPSVLWHPWHTKSSRWNYPEGGENPDSVHSEKWNEEETSLCPSWLWQHAEMSTTAVVLARYNARHKADSRTLWGMPADEAPQPERNVETAQQWPEAMGESWDWSLWTGWTAVPRDSWLLLFFHRGWLLDQHDSQGRHHQAWSSFCPVWYSIWNRLRSGPSVYLHSVPHHVQQVGHCSHHVVARSSSVHWKSRSSCKECQAHDVQVSARWHSCLWSSAWAQEHPSAGHWPQSYTGDVWTTDKNQTSSGHKPTSKQEAVSNGTEETYPKATDCEAKLQQTCKRPGSTPNRTTSVLAALGGTEVEKGDGPKPEEWTILHHRRRHWWCVPKKQSAHSTHMHLECSRTTGPDEWLAAEPGRSWWCLEECEHYTGRQFTRLWRAFQCTG